MMSVQPLPSFTSSGVNLDKCLVQDFYGPDAGYEKYESEPGSCCSDSFQKTSQSRPGTFLPIDGRGPYKGLTSGIENHMQPLLNPALIV